MMASSLSRHFAEDLLRGAMDLQESLVMLEKFQSVSRSMRKPNKKIRPETGEKSPGIHESLFEASNTKKVVPGNISNRFDGQLRNCTDDLKRVIKDSLYRKNLSSVSSSDEQASLSRSSRYAQNSSAVSKSTKQKVVPRSLSCAPVQAEKSKSPSLVARLMGLDGLPSHNSNTAKKDETLKTVSSPRAQFDIEMPRSKTPPSERLPKQLFGNHSGRKGKAGQEIMEISQVKRLLKTMLNSDEHKVQQHNVRMDFSYLRKNILPLQDTSIITELTQREQRIKQGRTKVPEDLKVVSHITRKHRIKQNTEINRRSIDTQKDHFTNRKGEGRKDRKAKTVLASPTNAKVVKKPDKKLIASSSNPSTCRTMKPILRRTPGNSREKTVSSRKTQNLTIDDIVAYEVIETDGPSTEHSATPSDESCQSADWDTEPSINDAWEDFSGSNEASLASSLSSPPINRTPAKEVEIKDEMSLLLLSDQSFLTRAAQLLGISAPYHLIEQYKGTSKAEMKNRELCIDIAAEQLERKLHQQNSPPYTVFRGKKCRATHFSLEALLGDISNGTRMLKSYTEGYCDDRARKDSLSMKLEKDLGCTDPSTNSVWDLGWQDWVCMEETECWVGDAGESVLSLLIEEIALDMLVN